MKLKKTFNCTAFKTWEACFAFLEWVLDHEDQFHGKRILEVGSGSGLCGQMIQCFIRDCSVVMSDYCADVTEYILGNIEESTLKTVITFVDMEVFTRLNTTPPSVCVIDFCNFSEQMIREMKADYLIATDVVGMIVSGYAKTFSPDLVDGLVELISFALKECACESASLV